VRQLAAGRRGLLKGALALPACADGRSGCSGRAASELRLPLDGRWLCNVRGAWARADSDGKRIVSVPAALRAEGSMVPDEFMIPFPRPRFDMDGTGCASSEYIPGGARAVKLAVRACERRGARCRGPMGGGEAGRGDARRAAGGAEGACGSGGGGRKGQSRLVWDAAARWSRSARSRSCGGWGQAQQRAQSASTAVQRGGHWHDWTEGWAARLATMQRRPTGCTGGDDESRVSTIAGRKGADRDRI
jgi:hypothetical protein